jgi:methylenetetrahydrofolate dehydrogenase (NADP+)/methenyltetrahydrofolate cyclohydrolase
MSRVLDGRAAAESIRREVASAVERMVAGGKPAPCLAVVLVGENPASLVYVRSKVRACEEAGLLTQEHRLPADASQATLLKVVYDLGAARDVDGILVQMPLPKGIDTRAVINAIDPGKDIDGFHPINVGRLWSSEPGFVPCTPLGIIELLEREKIAVEGAEAVVVGRSDIVGKPMAALLLRRQATVTVCHSRTRDLPRVAARADILVAAIGRPGFITGEFIKPGATVIDVGMNKVTDEATTRQLFGDDAERLAAVRTRGYTLVGDVHPTQVREIAGAHTPVPGGVGPLTVALLLRNTLEAARARREKRA